jgi:3-oxoacyl-[acyl-carrier protein] reductase
VDCSGFQQADQVLGLRSVLQEALAELQPGGHVLFSLARTPSFLAHAVIGFCRSLAKEYGRLGINCNVLRAEQPMLSGPVVDFFLSPAGAFISGQVIDCQSAPPRRPSHQPRGVAEYSAVVTGASNGIGQAIAATLGTSISNRYGSVLAIDRAALAPENPLRDISTLNFAQLDVTDEKAVLAAIQAHVERTGQRVQALVLNAGITRDGFFRKMSAERFEAVLQVNFLSIYRLVKALQEPKYRPLLAEEARITLTSSINALAGAAGQTNYAASKNALIGLLADEAPTCRDLGLVMNCVAPGFIETDMTRAMPAELYLLASLNNALVQAGHPQDIANCVEFLSSPLQAGLVNQTIRVCGFHLAG